MNSDLSRSISRKRVMFEQRDGTEQPSFSSRIGVVRRKARSEPSVHAAILPYRLSRHRTLRAQGFRDRHGNLTIVGTRDGLTHVLCLRPKDLLRGRIEFQTPPCASVTSTGS